MIFRNCAPPPPQFKSLLAKNRLKKRIHEHCVSALRVSDGEYYVLIHPVSEQHNYEFGAIFKTAIYDGHLMTCDISNIRTYYFMSSVLSLWVDWHVRQRGRNMEVHFMSNKHIWIRYLKLGLMTVTEARVTDNGHSSSQLATWASAWRRSVPEGSDKTYGTWGSYVSTVIIGGGRPGFSSRQGEWLDFSLRHRFTTGSGIHPASYPIDTGVKAVGAWSWLLTSNCTEVKDEWSYTSTPPIHLHGVVLS